MYKTITLILLTAAILAVSGCGFSEDTVAKVGSKEIKVAEYKKELQRRFPGKESFADVDSAAKMQVLNSMTKQIQRLEAAKDMGLDQDKDLLDEVENQRDRMIYSKYYEKMIVDSVIDLVAVQEYLDKIKEEVKASHVLISYKGTRGGNDRSEQAAQKRAEEVVAKAKAGEDFSKLATEYSDDPSAKSNNGDLGYFTWGRMTQAFQEAAFNMEPGQISDPVKTEFGYHIIFLQDRRPNPQYDPDNLAAPTLDIKRRLYGEKREEATARWNKFSGEIKNEHNFTVLKDNIARIKTITEEKRNEGKSKAEDYSDSEKDISVAEWNGGNVTLGDVFELYKRNFNQLLPKLTDVTAMEQIADNFGLQELIVGIAKKEGVDQDPEIVNNIKDMIEKRMLSLVDRKAVNENIEVDDDEAMKYFEDHKDEYKNDSEIEIWEIFVKDKELAEKLLKRAKNGEDFETLAAKYTEDEAQKSKNGYLGYRAEKRRGAVSREAFKIGENQFGGPVRYRGGWTILKTGITKPETYKTFDESKSRVVSKLKSEKTKALKEEWEEEINDKFSIKINYPLLEKI